MRHIFLMSVTAIALGFLGLTMLLVPDVAVSAVASGLDGSLLPIIQLLGGLLIAFGYLNWMSRRAILGGVLGRPIVAANVAHGLAGTIVLLHLLTAHTELAVPWILLVIYLVYAVAFGKLLLSRARGFQNPSAL